MNEITTGFKNTHKAVNSLDNDEKGRNSISTLSGTRKTTTALDDIDDDLDENFDWDEIADEIALDGDD